MKKTFFFFFVLFLLFAVKDHLNAQNFEAICKEDIINFGVDNYLAHRQNWSITQSPTSHFMYVANSKGLLEYDGSNWKLYPFPKIIRSVYIDKKGDIYTGALGEFGVWKANKKGKLEYQSLKHLIEDKSFQNEAIWNILETKYGILFQSFAFVYILNNGKVRKVPTPSAVLFVHPVRDHYYVGGIGKGVYEFTGNEFRKLEGTDFLGKESITAILPTNTNDELLICTDKNIWVYKLGNIREFNRELNNFLLKNKLNKAIKIDDKTYLFGSILNGFVVCDNAGKIQTHFNQKNGLQDNTILGLCKDNESNVWLALDNGISMFNYNSPIKYYHDFDGSLGVVYDAEFFDGNIYIGTNHGLFAQKLDGNSKNFTFIPNTQGQVLNLEVIDNQLICGHNDGTFLINDFNSTKISNITGGGVIRKINDENTLIQGTYTNLGIYKKNKAGLWTFSHAITNYILPVRQLEVEKDNTIWVSKGFEGISRLELNDSLTKVIKEDKFISKNPGIANISKINNNIYFFDSDEVKYWVKSQFIVTKKLQPNEVSIKIFPFNNLIISINKGGELNFLSSNFSSIAIPIRKQYWVDSYENIELINNQYLLLCLENGFAVLPKKSLTNLKTSSFSPPIVRSFSIIDNPSRNQYFYQKQGKSVDVNYNENNVELKFAETNFASDGSFSYQLEGYSDSWEAFDIHKPLVFVNLKPENYTFKIRSNLNNEISEFQFTVNPPWFWNIWSQIFYILLIIAFAFILYKVHLNNLKKHQDRLKQIHKRRQEIQQQEITKIRNQYLEEDIIRKSEELANSMMTLIKKNELLYKIKNEVLKYLDSVRNTGSSQIIDLIDKNISNQQDWKVFETNFNQVHEVFLKKLLQENPTLSNGDLKLAAYLRMNLSSKEIAKLLNITPRSVELKRYRLRKKLGITNEENLNDFMMKYA